MKVLISTAAPDIGASIDPRFGRAASFLVVDTETGEWQALDNPALHSSGGAGIQAAQIASLNGCAAVISGEFGPNAFDALHAADIKMYQFGSAGSVEETLKRFKAGQLQQVGQPTSPGHHGG